ncbi:thrombomodulin-like isoform X2 [Gadus macrocephalus]|uniref:thrombomodulin-like isoform X2 n=1 Tax=Gadus macrocephalus TaxID=80720 RepID=UPI0028CB1BF7|nr:thrombomodulin-like isoform X2 [Gadus macrocephalus]
MKEVLFCVARLLVLLSLLAARLAHGGRPPLAYLEDCDDNTCFLLFPGAHDFAGARDACRAEGGILATLPSAAEARRVQELLLRASIGRFWIGLTLAEGRCPTNDSANYGYEWVTGAAAGISSNWTGVPDRCDRKCVSVSTDGAWQQESCEGTLDGFLCSAPFGWCRVTDRSAEPGEHAALNGSTNARRTPGGTLWTTRGEKGSRYIDFKWLCGHGKWWRAPWFCEVETGGCSHTCVNSMCTCPDGLKLHSNNVTCVDERECSDTADCTGEHVQCRERLDGGGSECSCRPGFVVSRENATRCDPHCDRSDCPAQCVVDAKGRSQCRCPSGYVVNDEQSTAPLCVRIDDYDDYSDPTHPTPGTSEGAGSRAPPPALPATGVPGYVRVGAALGITAFVAAAMAVLYLPLRCALRRASGTLELSPDGGGLTLQQVTTEKYQRFSFDKQSRETPGW